MGILWLSRRRWGEVFGSFFRRRKEDLRATGHRVAGGMFVVGFAGILTWLLVIGVQFGFAVLFTVFAVMVSLVISRVIAESGMPYIKIRSELMRVVRLFDAKVIMPVSLYFGVVMGILFTTTSQVSAAAMSTHALALHEGAGGRRRWPMAMLLVGVLAIGFVIGGAAHLHLNYHNPASLDGEEQPVNSPEGYMWIGDAFWGIDDLRSGQVDDPMYSRHGHVMLGAGMAGALFILCLLDPRWPLHPIGMLMVGSIMGGIMWPSVFVGWLIKKLVIRFGGARAYRKGQAFFLGLIIGELLATLIWTIVPVVLVAMHLPYKRPPVFMPTRTA